MAISSMFWQKRATHAVPSACSRYPPVGSGALRSKTPILSSPRNPPSKRFLPKRSLRFTHQPKFAVSLPNTRFRKSRSLLPRNCLLHPVEKDRRPGLHRRIDVTEIPLIGGDLPGRMQVELVEQQVELLLGEIDVDGRQRERVKRQVPGGEPGIFPLVRHRDDVVADQVKPFAVPHLARAGRIGSTPCSSSHLSTSKKKYCLLHSIPASAWRMTLAASSPTPAGVIA